LLTLFLCLFFITVFRFSISLSMSVCLHISLTWVARTDQDEIKSS
jgi:hypothetical protein